MAGIFYPPPDLLENDQDLSRATAVTRGWNGYRNKSAQKADPGEENSIAAPAGIRTRDLSITSPALSPLFVSPYCVSEWPLE